MRVTVLFFGILKDIVGLREESVEIEPNTTVGSLFDHYSRRFETLVAKRSSILFARNQEFAPAETILTDNDEVAFLPPVSGGSDQGSETERHVFALTRSVIDGSKLAREIQRPEDGAVVTFEGVV